MNKREIKEECYLDMLEDEINSVEAVINHIKKIRNKIGIFDEAVLQKDIIRAQFDLELALASLCILLRKMSENIFIHKGDRNGFSEKCGNSSSFFRNDLNNG